MDANIIWVKMLEPPEIEEETEEAEPVIKT
jgi:hypothetical protein